MFEMVDYLNEERAKQLNMPPHIVLRCDGAECSISRHSIDNFAEIADDHCILKDGVTLTCKTCGQIHYNRFIPLENQDSGYVDTWERCPSCDSINVEKTSALNKFVTCAAVGIINHYRCNDCGQHW